MPTPLRAPGITKRNVAEQLGCSPQTITRMVKRGELTTFRIGKRGVRFHQSEIDAIRTGETPQDAAIKAIVDAAPTLTAAQRHTLAALLAGTQPAGPPRVERKPKRLPPRRSRRSA